MKSGELAINGGRPVREDYLPYGRQSITKEDIEAVVEVLESDYLTTGPQIDLFEQKIAQYVGVKYAVAFSSGTAALHGACFAAGIKKGDQAITTPMTFAASANCILYQGGQPVFADINLKTYNIDPRCVEDLITDKTKAIIPVDFAGRPVDHGAIKKIASAHDLIVIEDAAHALGSTYKGEKTGSLSDMTVFSFHPVKHITTGEGGVVTTDNQVFYEKMVQFRNHGVTRDHAKISGDHGSWYYEMQFLGYNYRITDIQAALGVSQLKKLDGFISQRIHIASMYNEAFNDMEQLFLPYQDESCESAWHLYIIRLNLAKLKVGRKEIFEALKKENIGVNVHYIPVYYHPYYQELGYEKGLCPKTERLYEEIITLPLFSQMSVSDQTDVIKAVKKVIDYYAT